MCGIAGFTRYQNQGTIVTQEELLRIRDAMGRRGPDGSGIWMGHEGMAGLAHRRLSIIDLSEDGAQPMSTADGRLRIVFNGEIYNHRELRKDLEAHGYRFRSNSDTEVILNLYAERGIDCLRELRGMYAFALWDDREQGMLLARDPYGIKPLYLSDDGGTIRFASQVKALQVGTNVDLNPEPAGHVGFFLWGSVPEPYTLYKGIRSLPPGSWMWVCGGQVRAGNFRDIGAELSNGGAAGASLGDLCTLRQALLESVRAHLVADVPVGVFLSAGLDSTTLMALAAEAGASDLQAVTLAFREYAGTVADEQPLASLVAKQYGVRHRTEWVSLADFSGELDNILAAMDQPSIDGVNTYLVSRAAAATGLKVALSGLGGDELFGGYASFEQVPRLFKALRYSAGIPAFGSAFRRITAPLIRRYTSPKYAGLFEYGGSLGGAYLLRRAVFMPWELPDLLDPDLVREGWRELRPLERLATIVDPLTDMHSRICALESTCYMRNQLLRDSDWAGMAHSVEIRVPMADMTLLQQVRRLRSAGFGPGKKDMAQTPTVPLPREVLERKKSGFNVPIHDWLLASTDQRERGLRGWTKFVYKSFVG